MPEIQAAHADNLKRTGIANCNSTEFQFKNSKIQDWDAGSLFEAIILLIVLTDQFAVYVLSQIFLTHLLPDCYLLCIFSESSVSAPFGTKIQRSPLA